MTGTPRGASSILLGMFVGSAAIWAVPPAGAAPSEEPTPSPPHTTSRYIPHPLIRYEVTGVGVASYLTYQTNNGQQHERICRCPGRRR